MDSKDQNYPSAEIVYDHVQHSSKPVIRSQALPVALKGAGRRAFWYELAFMQHISL
jgi:hypothetical protein